MLARSIAEYAMLTFAGKQAKPGKQVDRKALKTIDSSNVFSDKFGINTFKQGLSKQRLYDAADLAILQRVRYLLQVERYTIEGAQRKLDHPETRRQVRRETLMDIRRNLDDLIQVIP